MTPEVALGHRRMARRRQLRLLAERRIDRDASSRSRRQRRPRPPARAVVD